MFECDLRTRRCNVANRSSCQFLLIVRYLHVVENSVAAKVLTVAQLQGIHHIISPRSSGQPQRHSAAKTSWRGRSFLGDEWHVSLGKRRALQLSLIETTPNNANAC